ncbi:MAG: glutamine cyclotransferase [Polyangiaceae bacterium]
MNTPSSTHSPSTRQRATVVREYGPFPVARVHGLTHDGTHVWFAHGKKVAAMNPETGAIEKEVEVPADAGTAFDGKHLYQIGDDKIRKMDPKTGRVVATLATPGMTNDNSGLAWDAGTLWVGQYKGRAIHQIDATTGKVLRTLRSDRFVTGVSFVDGDLWHGTWEDETSELRRVDPVTGRVLETLEVAGGVSGVEAKGDLLFCGAIERPVVRAVKRPART